MDRKEIYKIIDGERDYQDNLWNHRGEDCFENYAVPERKI
jgi:hypothetical protein